MTGGLPATGGEQRVESAPAPRSDGSATNDTSAIDSRRSLRSVGSSPEGGAQLRIGQPTRGARPSVSAGVAARANPRTWSTNASAPDLRTGAARRQARPAPSRRRQYRRVRGRSRASCARSSSAHPTMCRRSAGSARIADSGGMNGRVASSTRKRSRRAGRWRARPRRPSLNAASNTTGASTSAARGPGPVLRDHGVHPLAQQLPWVFVNQGNHAVLLCHAGA